MRGHAVPARGLIEDEKEHISRPKAEKILWKGRTAFLEAQHKSGLAEGDGRVSDRGEGKGPKDGLRSCEAERAAEAWKPVDKRVCQLEALCTGRQEILRK